MLDIALSTLRTRWTSFAGAFLALALGTAMIAMMALALAATFTAAHPGVSDEDAADALISARSMAATTAAIAVSVAVFVVIATFAFVVDERSRELALLRLVGATPRQVRRMVLAEAALVGAAASLTGCLLAPIGGVWLGHWMVANGVAPGWFHVGVNPIALLTAFAVGIAAAVLGAAAVAFRASRQRPASALREAAIAERGMTPLRWLLAVGMLIGAVATGWS